MDPRGIFEQLLSSGQELAAKGRGVAERGLGVPDSGDERSAMLSGLGKGAAVGGLLALLLGTRAGRRLAGSAIKLGSLAALGGLAYTTYQKWQRSQSAPADFGTPIGELTGDAVSTRSVTLLKAMIAAAKADGHIDADEAANIRKQIAHMGLESEFAKMVDDELERPLNPREIAALADSPAAAAEIYLTSMMVLDVDSPQERAYLDQLAEHLGLPQQYVSELEAEASS